MYTMHYKTTRGASIMKSCANEAELLTETKRLFARRCEAIARDTSNNVVAEVWRSNEPRLDDARGLWRWALFI